MNNETLPSSAMLAELHLRQIRELRCKLRQEFNHRHSLHTELLHARDSVLLRDRRIEELEAQVQSAERAVKLLTADRDYFAEKLGLCPHSCKPKQDCNCPDCGPCLVDLPEE